MSTREQNPLIQMLKKNTSINTCTCTESLAVKADVIYKVGALAGLNFTLDLRPEASGFSVGLYNCVLQLNNNLTV